MLSTAVAAWRNLVKRLSFDWLILTAGLVTILLAMILLAAGPIYADAVTVSALRRSLTTSTLADSSIVVEVRTPPDGYETVDRLATRAVTDAVAGMKVTISRLIDAQSLRLAVQESGEIVDLGQLRHMEGIEDHATLVEGSWPDGSAAAVQTTVSRSTAESLGLEVGDSFTLVDPRDRSREVELELAGIFQIEDTAERYWMDEELALAGVVETRGFRTFGPFIVDESTIPVVTQQATAAWRVLPDFDTLEIAEAAGVRARIARLPELINEELADVDESGRRFSEFRVATELDRLLSGTERSLTVTRSSVLALIIQLAVLAGYALALTSGLLAETRIAETALLRARGASPGQVLAVSGFEALLLTVPAALVSPLLAAATVDALVSIGPLAPIDLDVSPTVTPEARIMVYLAAAGAVIGLAWPAWRSARSLSGAGRRRSRQSARSTTQRAGVDVALVALAALAFWQLNSLGEQVSSTIQGRFGVDPILIAAPTLGLLAGSVLALRVVPLLARLGERVAAAGRNVVPTLSAWQMARRPLRYARAALLLIMAVAIGFFAASYSSTWLDSQRDQADFQVGADVRVHPDRRIGGSVGDLHLVSAQETIEGVSRSMPLTRLQGTLPGSDGPARFLLLDSSAAAEVVSLRQDLSPDFATLMAELSDARPAISGIILPGKPVGVAVVIDTVEEELDDPSGHVPPLAFSGTMSLVFQDDDGLLHRVGLGVMSVNEGPQTLDASLVADLTDGGRATPAYPIQLVSIETTSRFPFDTSRTVTLDIVDLLIAEVPGAWETLDVDRDLDSWDTQVATIGQPHRPPSITETPIQPDHAHRVSIATGVGFSGVAAYSINPPWPSPQTFPVIVPFGWLERSGSQLGDEMVVPSLSTGRSRPQIAGVVEAFPTTDTRDANFLLIDLPTYQLIRYAPGSSIIEVDESWLATGEDEDNVVEALYSPPFEATNVMSRSQRFVVLATDPVALATIGALTIGFLAAAVFAAVGFAVSATVSARERITEFALLRALGLSPRLLGAWMTLEQGVLVVSSLAFGTLVGWLLTTVILPLITVTQAGTRPVPDVAIVYPWDAVLVLETSLVAVLAVIVVAMTLLLRRLGLGSLLRLGEE